MPRLKVLEYAMLQPDYRPSTRHRFGCLGIHVISPMASIDASVGNAAGHACRCSTRMASERFRCDRDHLNSTRECHQLRSGYRSRASGQPWPDRYRHPSTRRLHCLRGALSGDGFDRAAPRTRRSPCDPRPAAAGGVGDGGRMACGHKGGTLVGRHNEGAPCRDNGGEREPVACFYRRELADHYRHQLDQGSF